MRLVICCFEIDAIVDWYTKIARDMDGKNNMRLHTMYSRCIFVELGIMP